MLEREIKFRRMLGRDVHYERVMTKLWPKIKIKAIYNNKLFIIYKVIFGQNIKILSKKDGWERGMNQDGTF